MHRVPVRELNQHTADVLALVERGERVEVTRHGTAVAIIEPIRPDPLRGLIESGELRPASGPLPLVSRPDAWAEGSPGVDAVVEDRDGPDRW